MIETVVALLMFVNGEIKNSCANKMAACLKEDVMHQRVVKLRICMIQIIKVKAEIVIREILPILEEKILVIKMH